MKWKDRCNILLYTAFDLDRIHSNNYIHKDLHSGNILLDKSNNVYIADLGLSTQNNEESDNNYGIIPYMAPEIFCDQPLTTAVDIYSFGIIMWEISSGKVAHYDRKEFNDSLVQEICQGLRPKFVKEIPIIYVELANQCMNADASKRPSANHIIQILYMLTQDYCIDFFKEADSKIKKLESETSKNDDIISSCRTYKLILSNLKKPMNSTDIPEFNLDKYKSRIS
ncbi:kinase-like domain-containing protein [Gigaspora rosea]|uniref:Kinase-like domain-containing protein n=1 Tax=Gigaspora rosea TaxID=44941 RepID=A0A397VAF7_9GLOM|nr:kinase-like domain-containing protein [Gigaspora rosea]